MMITLLAVNLYRGSRATLFLWDWRKTPIHPFQFPPVMLLPRWQWWLGFLHLSIYLAKSGLQQVNFGLNVEFGNWDLNCVYIPTTEEKVFWKLLIFFCVVNWLLFNFVNACCHFKIEILIWLQYCSLFLQTCFIRYFIFSFLLYSCVLFLNFGNTWFLVQLY